MQTVLVTGAAGYIGSVLTSQLLNRGYRVLGFDKLLFGGDGLLSVYNHPNFEFVKGDILNVDDVKMALSKVDHIVHLAAIVGDPACAKQPELALQTNWEASKMLFDMATNSKNLQRFIFASTCSNYGKMDGVDFVTEESPLNPVSLYAELKVKFENYILNSETRSKFIKTALRFSTVYGLSPRMRFDLTVNEFMRDVSQGKELVIFGEQFWRPYAHVEDLARACVLVLESKDSLVDKEVFGVGATEENYSKKMLAEEILKLVPSAKISYVKKNEDPRDYRANFDKIKNILGFKISKTVPSGLAEIHNVIKDGLLLNPNDQKYKNT